MEITKEMKAGYCVVRLDGRLDAVTAPEVEGFLGQEVEEGKAALAVDLSGVDYVSSAGLRVFLVTAKKLKASGGELSLAGLTGNVKEVIEISGFPSIMPCFDSVNDLPAK